MSTLYNFKIKKLEVTSKPIEQIVDVAYHSSEDNFRHRMKKWGLDLSKEPSKIRTPRYLELLKEIKATRGVDFLKNLSGFGSNHSFEIWKRLRESYGNNSDLLHGYQSIVGNNLFHTVLGEEDKILPVLMVNIEIISVHPDAGYPRFRQNPKTTKTDERNFLLRILSDAIYEHDPENILVKESNKTTKWDKNKKGRDYLMDASKIIWGFERYKGLKIRLASSKSFWKKNEDQWWSGLRDSYFSEKSDNKPFELVAYDLMIHPGWKEELSHSLGQQIESTAHWS